MFLCHYRRNLVHRLQLMAAEEIAVAKNGIIMIHNPHTLIAGITPAMEAATPSTWAVTFAPWVSSVLWIAIPSKQFLPGGLARRWILFTLPASFRSWANDFALVKHIRTTLSTILGRAEF